MIADTLAPELYLIDLRQHGLPYAEQQAKKRKTMDTVVFKHRPTICHGCTTTLFCHACDYGQWIED